MSIEENTTIEKKEDPIISKEKSTKETKKEKLSVKEQIVNKINEKIDAGIIPNDKSSLIELRKIILDELKINKNNRGTVKTEIEKIMIARKLSSAGLEFKSEKIDGINLSVDPITAPSETPQNQALSPQQTQNLSALGNNNQTNTIQKGALPLVQNQTEEPVKQLSPQQIKSQEKFFKKIFGFAGDMMITMGFVETDDEEELKELEKPKPIKKFRAEMDDLSKEMSELTTAYGMALPKYLDLIAFGISIISVIGMPIISKMMMSDKEPQEKNFEKIDEIEVKL